METLLIILAVGGTFGFFGAGAGGQPAWLIVTAVALGSLHVGYQIRAGQESSES